MSADSENDSLKRYWSARIDAARTIAELDDIDAQIPREQFLGSLRFKLALRKRNLRGDAGTAATRTGEDSIPGVTSSASANAGVSAAFASAYGLSAPDGRRLHGYRLSGEAFEQLRSDLIAKGDYAALERGYTPGLFVLWASEWFRRSYQGGTRRWEDLAAALGLPPPGQVEQNRLRNLTAKGMRLWRRDLFSQGNTHYLASLAREGGFPAAAVEDGGRGWARDVLSAIVGPLMGNAAAGEIEALEFARAQKYRLPNVFQDDEFIQLCADLALAISTLRREVEPHALAAGLPVAAWLQLNRPDWRDVLPLTTGDTAADALVETLLQVAAVSSDLVGVERLLWREIQGLWQEAVRLKLDGEIAGGSLMGAEEREGRLRAFAGGALARYFPGELALFEPPSAGDINWLVRSARQSRGVQVVPFSVPVELDLRSGESWVTRIIPPGGKALRGQLLVAELDEGISEQPSVLRVIGSGSGNYRAAEVYLRVPAEWSVRSGQDEEVDCLGPAEAATLLWRVRSGATVLDSDGDCYRILCGQSMDRTNRLEVLGNRASFVEVSGVADLFVGSPVISRNRAGEVVWRRIGERNWQSAPSNLPCGHYEVGWRLDGIMLDRRRIGVLPKAASLNVSRSSKGSSYELSGFGNVSIVPENDGPVVPSSDGTRWLPKSAAAASVHRFAAQISWPDAPPLDVSVAYPCVASIAHWDGRTLPHNTRVTLADLRDLVAVAQGKMELVATLRDNASGQRAEMSWEFVSEMPLGAVSADIANLLLPASIDASVILDMHDGYNNNWHVQQFPSHLKHENGGYVANHAIVIEGVELCGRSFADPGNEVSFGSYSLLTDSNHRPAMLPDDLCGTWLVYLRAQEKVLTRPLYSSCQRPVDAPPSRLGRAMSLPPGNTLDDALSEILRTAGREIEEADAILQELICLVTSLRGLPPSTFRVLSILPDWPLVLARMALSATADERDAVMGLSDALPFAWHLLPLQIWNAARGIALSKNMETLALLGEDSKRFAKQMVDIASEALIDRVPLLGPVLRGPGECGEIEDITMHFIHRGAIDRIREPCQERYRERLGQFLPSYFERFDRLVLDTFDAPCAAALAVAGTWQPQAEDVHHMNSVARSFPTWFSEAFAASLKEYL